MNPAPATFAQSPEALVVGLAKTGDTDAFAELVRRRQSWIRSLMYRYSGDQSLADDLAQQAFLQAWRDIGKLADAHKFGAWLRKVAVNIWYQHLRKNDALRDATDHIEDSTKVTPATSTGMDLDRALAELNPEVRQCIILSYHEGMSHSEVAELTGIPIGTVKSHIRRGAEQLKTLLAAYVEQEVETHP